MKTDSELLKQQNDQASALQSHQREHDEKMHTLANDQVSALQSHQREHDEKMHTLAGENSKALLEVQQRGDADRERGMTFYSTKMKIYEALLEELGQVTTKSCLKGEDFTQLSILILRVAYVAHPDVIAELVKFAESLHAAVEFPVDDEEKDETRQEQITPTERMDILVYFSAVSAAIRKDLMKDRNSIEENSTVDQASLQAIIKHFLNAAQLADQTADKSTQSTSSLSANSTSAKEEQLSEESPCTEQPSGEPQTEDQFSVFSTTSQDVLVTVASMTEEGFLDRCKSGQERLFFEDFFKLLKRARFQVFWTQKGFSIERTMKFYPTQQEGNFNSNLINRPANGARRTSVESALHAAGVSLYFRKDENLRFNWNHMKDSKPEDFINIAQALLR